MRDRPEILRHSELLTGSWAGAGIILPVFACLLLLQVISIQHAIVAAVALSFAAGVELDQMAFLTAQYFGTAHHPKM
jgi:hypothetical protein